jgi:FkbH-like protein
MGGAASGAGVLMPKLQPEWEVARLSARPRDERLSAALQLLAAWDASRTSIPTGACDALIDALADAAPGFLDSVATSAAAAAASLYVRAKLLGARHDVDPDVVADAWEHLLARVPSPDPLVMLQAARALSRTSRTEIAATRLRGALALGPGYSFHARAQGLVADLWDRHPPALRQARIAVLGASTTSLLIPVLRALCFRDGVNAEFYEGPYGSYRQEIWNPASGLYAFKPTIVFIVTHWRELSLPPLSEDGAATVDRVVGEYEALWRALGENAGCHVVQHGFDLPLEESHDYVAWAHAAGRRRCIEEINLELTRRAPAHVSVLDAAAVESEVGSAAWHDAALWHTARQHPACAALPPIAELQSAHIRAVCGLSKKVVVCDLDNTLWGGIIGEDGIDGIRIGPGSPKGEAYLRLQEYLLELKRRGVLLAVCSKNNPDEARQAVEQHPHMRLRADDFVAFVANWNDKAENLRTISRMLGLGTDSFVFLDDNPVERAWVRSQLPDVAVVELGTSPYTYVTDLDRGRYFFSLTLTEEDSQRAELYKSEIKRQAVRSAAASLEEFLEELQMRASDVPVTSDNLARVTQLVNKTNQFNVTARRHQSSEIEAIAGRADAWARAFTLSDRFGDHGLIGVLLCVADAPQSWHIDTWVMSCRVLGRGMERFMFERLHDAARAAGVRRIVGTYKPTKRNQPVAELFPQLGFETVAATGEESAYVFAITERAELPAHTIELVTA